MSNLGEELYKRYYKIGYEIGLKEARKQNCIFKMAKSLMQTQNWTALQALKAMGISENEIPEYITLLEEKD